MAEIQVIFYRLILVFLLMIGGLSVIIRFLKRK